MAKSSKVFGLFELCWRAFAQYKWRIVLIAVLSFISSILEGVGINAIIPLFAFVDRSQTGATDVISQTIEKAFLYFNLDFTIKSLIIFVVLLFVIKAVILFINHYIIAKNQADYQKNTRSELLKLTFASNWPYLSKQKVGYLDQVLTTDIDHASTLLLYIGGFILLLGNLVIYSLIAVNISFIIAALALIMGGIIFVIFQPLFHKNKIASAEFAQKYKELAHYINENTISMKAVKSMFVGNQVLKRGIAYFDRIKNLVVKVALLQNITNVVLQPIGFIFLVGVFAFSYKTAAFNLGSFAVIVYAINKVFANIQSAQSQAQKIYSQVPHLISVLDYKEEVKEHQEKDTGIKKMQFNNHLEIKAVSFSYDSQGKMLSELNFDIPKGKMIGLIGPSGAGKTTIVDLLLRLLKPQKGVILLDGEDISNISLREWRTKIGYVSQDIFLINNTLESNIKFYDEFITDEAMIAATKMANIYDFIESLPDKFQTMVGERGIRLSGGERQRIALARALARKPQLLILDEATSALDNESEALIQRAIDGLRGKTTVFVIAHRLSTVMNSDRLIVLEKGRIIEQGSPEELLKNKNSYFFRVYNVRE